jgi:four helix bundle protein
MTVYDHRDLICWQLAEAFKKEVFRLVRSSRAIQRESKYRSQLIESASSVSKNIVEGFRRFKRGYIKEFFSYALASLHEAEARLRDGIELGYFDAKDCQEALRYAKRCTVATVRFKRSQDSNPPASD